MYFPLIVFFVLLVAGSHIFRPKGNGTICRDRVCSLKSQCIRNCPSKVLFNENFKVLFPDIRIENMHQAATVLGLTLYEVYSSQVSEIMEYDSVTLMQRKIDNTGIKQVTKLMQFDPYLQKVLKTKYHQSKFIKTSIRQIINSGAQLFSCIFNSPYSIEYNVYFDLCINIFILQCVVRGGLRFSKPCYAKILTLATISEIDYLIGDQLRDLVCNNEVWEEEFGHKGSYNYDYRIPGLVTAAINHAVDQELSKAILNSGVVRYFFVDRYSLFIQFLAGLERKHREFLQHSLVLPAYNSSDYRLFNVDPLSNLDIKVIALYPRDYDDLSKASVNNVGDLRLGLQKVYDLFSFYENSSKCETQPRIILRIRPGQMILVSPVSIKASFAVLSWVQNTPTRFFLAWKLLSNKDPLAMYYLANYDVGLIKVNRKIN